MAFINFVLLFVLSLSAWAEYPQGAQMDPITPSSLYGTAPKQPPSRPQSGFFEEDEFEPSEDELDAIGDEIARQRRERTTDRNVSNARTTAPVDLSRINPDLENRHTVRSSRKNPKNTCYYLNPFTGESNGTIENFDFPEADIKQIAKALGKLTCLNFVYDEKEVNGKISIITNSSITVGNAWKVFLTALDANGLSLIPSGNEGEDLNKMFFRIAKLRDVKEKQIRLTKGIHVPHTSMHFNHFLPIKFADAQELVQIFRNFMPPSARIAAYPPANMIMISDTGENIGKLIEMIGLLDVESFDEKLEFIPLRHASAQSVGKLLEQVLFQDSNRARFAGAPGSSPFAGGGAMSGIRKTREGGVISHIIPDERTNSVIVSANEKGMAQVHNLVRRLDRRRKSSNGSSVNVVHLRYAEAEQIAQTLNNIATGAGTSGAGSSGSAPMQNFEGAIKVTADKPTNSLVVTASPNDFTKIDSVISELDITRDQVLVKTVIMEMTMERGFDLGTTIAAPTSNIGFQGNDSDFTKFLMNPLSLTGLVMGFQAGKGGKTIQIPGGPAFTVRSVQGLIRALQSYTNSNVLSSPQIMTLDNQKATIEVAENIPIPSTTAVQGAGTQQSITREKVGLSLTITPQINKQTGNVKLDIKQKFEDISSRVPPKGVADLAFATLSRSSETTVVVKNGDTVALGGLVRDKVEEKQVKIPLLGDIPILGWLFRSKSTNSVKQNLIAFITPRVISEYSDVRKVLDDEIRDRDDFIEKNGGGEDQFQDYKEKMIKRLPAPEDLKDPVVKRTANNVDDEDEEENVAVTMPTAKPDTQIADTAVETLTESSPAEPLMPEDATLGSEVKPVMNSVRSGSEELLEDQPSLEPIEI